jgi:bis(5'-nucleosyl)-tetraphosphatase (symmetrical)
MQRIFVGDVQGCADELDQILARAQRRYGSEVEIWFVGDLVNRGPHDLRVLEAVRERVEAGQAQSIVGNHELAMLRLSFGLREVGPLDTVHRLLARPDGAEWVAWIRSRPVVLTGQLGGRPFAMLHGASAPDWSLAELSRRAAAISEWLGATEESRAHRFLAGEAGPDEARDDLARITTCRSVDEAGWSPRVPEEGGRGARPWHEAWAARGHSHGLVYGHWAMQGLHLAPSLRGLDTACVHHGHCEQGLLTAWLPDESAADPFALPDEGFWQVPAARRYYRI